MEDSPTAIRDTSDTPPARTLPRDTSLLIFCAILLLFFVVTGFTARLYHGEEKRLSVRWFVRGQAAMAAGRAAEGVQDFRTALVYSRENGENSGGNADYDLSLARALEASGHLNESRAYLLGLVERTPGSATLNLELARLSAIQNDVDDAIRFYTAAIYGVWESNPIEQRRKVRAEFAQFLLKHGRQVDAQAELITFAAALPPDPAEHVKAGNLLLGAGEVDEALRQFKIAIDEDQRAPGALRGAGLTEFQVGEYSAAAKYLERAEQEAPLDGDAAHAREESQEVVEMDPFSPGLPAAERARRAARAFQLSNARLQSCTNSRNDSLNMAGAPISLQPFYQHTLTQKEYAIASESALTRHPENVSPVMDLVFQVEAAVTATCGQPTGADAALGVIARMRAKVMP